MQDQKERKTSVSEKKENDYRRWGASWKPTVKIWIYKARVAEIATHLKYDGAKLRYDLAVVRLSGLE